MRIIPRIRRAVRHPVATAARIEYRRSGFRRRAKSGLLFTERALGDLRYQPYHGLGGRRGNLRRSVEDRWALIEPHLPATGSALDVGTQNGWFAFKLAERGLFALGVDNDERGVRVAQWLTLLNPPGGAAFVYADIGPDRARALPGCDVVLCLSVFHHLVRFGGLDHARATMQALADCTRDRLFFETGQPGEIGIAGEGQLGFMEPNPLQWMVEFLTSLGFSEVRHLGDTPGFRHERPRHLLVALR